MKAQAAAGRIAGLAGTDAVRHERTVGAMGAIQAHRGPDGTMHAAAMDRRAVLAMNTLLIVDPQAMPGPYLDRGTGILLAFNGEIYNYRQQAAAWGIPLGHRETDAHFVLRAWAKLGPSCLDGLDGMFALAVYDPRAGKLFLARDRLGEKPLYWRLDGGRLAFASEVTTLTGYGPSPLVLRPEVLAIETPVGVDTPFQGIQLLAPATLLTFDVTTGSLDQHTYWSLADRQPFTGTYHEALATFSVVLAAQVPLRAPACDFALLLSGGLDSSVLAYLLRPPVCVTVRYLGRDRLDESKTAARIAADIGAELVVVEPDPVDFTKVLPHILGRCLQARHRRRPRLTCSRRRTEASRTRCHGHRHRPAGYRQRPEDAPRTRLHRRPDRGCPGHRPAAAPDRVAAVLRHRPAPARRPRSEPEGHRRSRNPQHRDVARGRLDRPIAGPSLTHTLPYIAADPRLPKLGIRTDSWCTTHPNDTTEAPIHNAPLALPPRHTGGRPKTAGVTQIDRQKSPSGGSAHDPPPRAVLIERGKRHHCRSECSRSCDPCKGDPSRMRRLRGADAGGGPRPEQRTPAQ